MSVLFAEMDPANAPNPLSVCGQKNQKPPQSSQPQQLPSPTSSSSAAALQLAFELSMLSLSTCNNNVGNDMIVNMGNDHQQQQANLKSCSNNKSPSSSLSPNDVGGINGINSVLSNNIGLSAFTTMLPNLDDRSKKSQNMTECVPVPSSEHVAEIVGRQGCKIKALRAKTNTYIKTPVRGEEPVFVVTGRKEDVAKAKREILSAAEHFSLIRASRKPSLSGVSGKGTPAGPPANVPGQITIQVRVPYRVVGLVVGPKGATIKHIQQQTHTYIVTPSRDKEPVFEVTGMPDNVQSARRQIEAHIALRTGNAAAALNGLNSGLLNGLSNSNSGLSSLLNGEDTPEILASLYKNGLGSLFGYLDGSNPQELYGNGTVCPNGLNGKNDIGVVNVLPSSAGSSTCSSNSSTSSQSSKSAIMTLPELINIWKRSDATPVDIDEGLGDSPQPNIWSMPTPGQSFASSSSPTASVSPTDSLLASFNCKNNGMQPNGININTLVGLNNMKGVVNSMNGNMNGVGTILCGSKNVTGAQQRECMVCGDKDVSAALVPCGHNMFCLDCANRICSSGESTCPICNETVIQAIRIIA